MSFSNLGLAQNIETSINVFGFKTPTDIQKETIPLLLKGKDVVGVAQTGTGKTAAFVLPMLQNINLKSTDVQGLVIAPTRELAIQSADFIENFCKTASGIISKVKVATIYGGAPYPPQLKLLKSGVNIVVATPGRLIDIIERKAINLATVKMVVLDEADEMLKMGFAEDVEEILSNTIDESRQTVLFSATMPPAIRKIADTYMRNPINVQISSPTSTHDNIMQKFAVVQGRGKTMAAYKFIMSTGAAGTIVFTRTRASADIVGVELAGMGLRTAVISGDKSQKERERIVERMKAGRIQVLIATDVAARGLDIDVIELVINYDLPDELENYIHRIGRTGRAGRNGTAISFVTPNGLRRIRDIEKMTKAKITEADIPETTEVRHLQAVRVLQKVGERKAKGKLKHYENAVLHTLQKLESEQELLEFVSAFVALNVGDDGSTSSTNSSNSSTRDRREGGGRTESGRGGRGKRDENGKRRETGGGRGSRSENGEQRRKRDGKKRSESSGNRRESGFGTQKRTDKFSRGDGKSKGTTAHKHKSNDNNKKSKQKSNGKKKGIAKGSRSAVKRSKR